MLSVALSLSLAEARPAGRYPAPLFRGARTFLASHARAAAARPSGRTDISVSAAAFEWARSIGPNVRFGWKADGCVLANDLLIGCAVDAVDQMLTIPRSWAL